MESDIDMNFILVNKEFIENNFKKANPLFQNIQPIFKVFTKVNAKNENWEQNLASFLTYIEDDLQPEFIEQVPKIIEKKSKVKKGKAFYSEVPLDDVQDAQIFKGPNPNIIENSGSHVAEIDASILDRVNENIRSGQKLEFRDSYGKLWFNFEPKANLESKNCEIQGQYLKIFFVSNKFLIQATLESNKSYVCLSESPIFPNQIFQVGQSTIITNYKGGKYQFKIFSNKSNVLTEKIEEDTVIYIENEVLTLDKTSDTHPALKILKNGNKWTVQCFKNKFELFRSIHNFETSSFNKSSSFIKKDSHPLLLLNNMLLNIGDVFLKVVIKPKDPLF